MPHTSSGEPNDTNTDIFERANKVRTWLGQWSGSLKALRLPTGLLDFRLLTQAPANPPAGWARFSILNNVLRLLDSTGAELLAVGGADLTHHAYPWAMRRDKTAVGLENTAFFFDRQTFVQWSNGWTVTEDKGSVDNSTSSVRVGEELDARTPNRRTTFYQVNALNLEEGRTALFDMRIAMPNGFATWGTNGIILRHKIRMLAGGGGADTDLGRVTLSVFDPTTGSDTVAESTARERAADVADDTAYQDLQITGATLNGMTNPLAAGEMLHVRIDLGGEFGAGSNVPTFELGRLSAYFE